MSGGILLLDGARDTEENGTAQKQKDGFCSAMMADVQSLDRMGAIKELVDRLHEAGYVTDSLDFLQSVLDREDLESTVVGQGVAFPHARCRSAARLGMVFGVSRSGVDFHCEQHPGPVRLICLLAVPVIGDVRYLPLLGDLARLFNPEFMTEFSTVRSSEEMCGRLLQHIRSEEALATTSLSCKTF